MKKIKTGVIGVGYLGRFHAQKHAALNNIIDFQGVYDVHSDSAKKVAHEVSTRAFSTIDEMLTQVDAVTIATPTTYHFEVAKKCLDSGKHLLIEKPITSTTEQAQILVDLANKKGVVVQCGYVERYSPPFKEAQKRLTEINMLECFRYAPFKPRALDVDVVTDLMIHDLDLVLQVINSDVTQVHAWGQSVVTNTWDIMNAELVFQNGARAFLGVSRCAPIAVRLMSAYSRNTHFHIDMGALKLSTITRGTSISEPIQEVKEFAKSDALLEETEQFIMTVRGERAPVATAKEAMMSLNLVEKVLESAKQKER